MPCRQRNTQFFKDGRKTAWWVKHIDLPKLFPRRAASLEARSLADVPVQEPTKYELASSKKAGLVLSGPTVPPTQVDARMKRRQCRFMAPFGSSEPSQRCRFTESVTDIMVTLVEV
jgi:hypothetical protein